MTMVNDQSVLQRLFLQHQRVLRAALELSRNAIDHPTSKGDASEGQWRKMLSAYLPKRYRVCNGHVVDSRGGVSKQIEGIIHDAHHCPALLYDDGLFFRSSESGFACF